jgi:hypothetical protein
MLRVNNAKMQDLNSTGTDNANVTQKIKKNIQQCSSSYMEHWLEEQSTVIFM